jgi:hypothetical protein
MQACINVSGAFLNAILQSIAQLTVADNILSLKSLTCVHGARESAQLRQTLVASDPHCNEIESPNSNQLAITATPMDTHTPCTSQMRGPPELGAAALGRAQSDHRSSRLAKHVAVGGRLSPASLLSPGWAPVWFHKLAECGNQATHS